MTQPTSSKSGSYEIQGQKHFWGKKQKNGKGFLMVFSGVVQNHQKGFFESFFMVFSEVVQNPQKGFFEGFRRFLPPPMSRRDGHHKYIIHYLPIANPFSANSLWSLEW